MIYGIPGPAAVGAKHTQRTAATMVRIKLTPVKNINPIRYLHTPRWLPKHFSIPSSSQGKHFFFFGWRIFENYLLAENISNEFLNLVQGYNNTFLLLCSEPRRDACPLQYSRLQDWWTWQLCQLEAQQGKPASILRKYTAILGLLICFSSHAWRDHSHWSCIKRICCIKKNAKKKKEH